MLTGTSAKSACATVHLGNALYTSLGSTEINYMINIIIRETGEKIQVFCHLVKMYFLTSQYICGEGDEKFRRAVLTFKSQN